MYSSGIWITRSSKTLDNSTADLCITVYRERSLPIKTRRLLAFRGPPVNPETGEAVGSAHAANGNLLDAIKLPFGIRSRSITHFSTAVEDAFQCWMTGSPNNYTQIKKDVSLKKAALYERRQKPRRLCLY